MDYKEIDKLYEDVKNNRVNKELFRERCKELISHKDCDHDYVTKFGVVECQFCGEEML